MLSPTYAIGGLYICTSPVLGNEPIGVNGVLVPWRLEFHHDPLLLLASKLRLIYVVPTVGYNLV